MAMASRAFWLARPQQDRRFSSSSYLRARREYVWTTGLGWAIANCMSGLSIVRLFSLSLRGPSERSLSAGQVAEPLARTLEEETLAPWERRTAVEKNE